MNNKKPPVATRRLFLFFPELFPAVFRGFYEEKWLRLHPEGSIWIVFNIDGWLSRNELLKKYDMD